MCTFEVEVVVTGAGIPGAMPARPTELEGGVGTTRGVFKMGGVGRRGAVWPTVML